MIGFSVQWHGDQHFLSLDVPIHPAIAGCIYHLALPTEWPMGYNARNDEIRAYDPERKRPTWCRYSYLALGRGSPITGAGFLHEPKAHMFRHDVGYQASTPDVGYSNLAPSRCAKAVVLKRNFCDDRA